MLIQKRDKDLDRDKQEQLPEGKAYEETKYDRHKDRAVCDAV